MPEAGRRAAAHKGGQPIHIRRPEGEAGDQAIDVSDCREPVMNPLAQGIAKNAAASFAERSVGKKRPERCSRLSSLLIRQIIVLGGIDLLGTKAQVMQGHADDPAQHGEIADPLSGPFQMRTIQGMRGSLGSPRRPRDWWRRAARRSRPFRRCPPDRRRRPFESGVLAKLSGASSARSFMSSFVPKCRQPVGQDLMHAGSSPSLTRSEHSVHLKHLLRLRIELRDVERAAGDAIPAANAVVLLEIDDAVGVLDDGAVGGAGAPGTRVGAVHALVFAHQPQRACRLRAGAR